MNSAEKETLINKHKDEKGIIDYDMEILKLLEKIEENTKK